MKKRIENLNNNLTYRLENGLNAAVFWVIFGLIAVSAVLYFYLLTSSVFNIAWRTDTETKISVLRSNVSELESNYLKAISGLSAERAEEFGLKEFNKPIFAALEDGDKLSFNSPNNF